MSEKPSYFEVLNAIALREARDHALFDAWAKATRDTELAGALNMVAIREREHAAAFTKRLCELGYGVREELAGDFEARLQKLQSNASDAEKFESEFGYGRERDDAGLAGIFADTSIDPLTGKLLGRFIAEERDSRRRLEAQYERVQAKSIDDAGLDRISERLERLTRTIEELKMLRQKRR